jgi:autotransporter translocation and assembly factor TamB
MVDPAQRRRRAGRLAVLLAMLLCVADFVVVYAWIMKYLNGPALGRYVTQVAARGNLRGRVEVKSVTWSGRAVFDLLLGKPHAIAVEELRVFDPDGKLALHVPHATIGVELRPALRGRYYLHDIDLPAGFVRLHEKKEAPGKGAFGLIAAFQPRPPTTPQPKPVAEKPRPGPVVVIRNARVANLDFGLNFTNDKNEPEGAWGLVVKQLATGADVRLDARNPKKVELAFTAWNPTAPQGELRIGPFRYPIRDLVIRLAVMRQNRPGDFEFDATFTSEGNSVHGAGALLAMLGPDGAIACTVKLKDAGASLRRTVSPIFGGPVVGTFDIRGKLKDGPVIDGVLEHVTATVGPLRATETRARLVVASGRLRLEGVDGRLGDGRLRGDALFDFPADRWSAKAAIVDVDTTNLVGRDLRKLAAGRASGGAKIAASFVGPTAVKVTDVDVTLRRRFGAPLPPQVRVRGNATVRQDSVDLRDVEVAAAGASVTAQGRVLTRRKELDLAITVAAQHAGELLRAMKAPPVVEALTASASVKGRLDNPVVEGSLTAAGVGQPGVRLDTVSARLGLRNGTLALEEVRASGLGGTASGRASAQLFQGNLARLSRDPVIGATLAVKRVAVDRLLRGGDLKGTLAGDVAIEGPLSSPVGHAAVRSEDFSAYGDRYSEVAADVDVKGRVVTARRVVMRRQAGGDLRAHGTMGFDGALDLNVLATRFPLQAVPKMSDLPFSVSGLISGEMQLTGDLNRPSVGGFVALAGMRLRNILLGNGKLKLEPGGDAVRLTGTFFDRVDVDGYLTLGSRSALFVKITLRRMPLESLIPELTLIDTRGLVSGTIQLSFTADGLKDAQARLTELSVIVEPRRETEDEKRRFELRNKDPIALSYRDERLEFEHLRLTSASGDLEAMGFVGAKGSNARLKGALGLELLEYLARGVFEHTHGDLLVNLAFKGPLAKPELTGTLDVRKASVTPKESDRPIVVPDAKLELLRDALVVHGAKVTLDGSTLTLAGRLGLSDFKPTTVDFKVTGETSARALQIGLPRHFSEASGKVGMSLTVRGPAASPRLAGRLLPKEVVLTVRALGRELGLRSGAIDVTGALTDLTLTARTVRGTLDEGEFTLDGTAALQDFALADLDVRFQGMGIPHRAPRVYELSVNADLRATMVDRRVALAGTVDLVDGRYVQRFDLLKDVLEPQRTHVESKPFWRGVKLLEEMALALQVRTTGTVFVRNNLADISLDVALEVRGTLPDTRLSGDIRTVEGAFSIPFLRGRFQVQEGGTISFDPGKEIPSETPRVRIVGETLYIDSREQEHQITLTLDGPLAGLSFDMVSNTGLSKNQCLALLSTGRTTEEVRAMVTGRSETGAPQQPGAAAAADQALKTITSDFMSLLVEDPLKKVLKLDLARLEFGTESIEVRLGWRIGRHIRLLGSHELGLLGDSHTDGKAELKISDNLLVVPEVERLVRGQQTEQETILRGKAQLKLRLLLR